MLYNYNTNNNRCCYPIEQINECGVVCCIDCSECCTRVCNQVTYTVTVTNTSSSELNNAVLSIPLDDAFCLMRNSLVVNGTMCQCLDLSAIPLGTISPGQIVTVTFVVTVMTCKRYIKERATLTFTSCCCFTKRCLTIPSNISVLQVCCCCCNNQTSN